LSMTDRYIPLNKPFLGPEESKAAVEDLESGDLGGDCPIGRAVEEYLKGSFAVKHVLLTTSCTHAMEMLQRPGMRDPVGMVSGLWTR